MSQDSTGLSDYVRRGGPPDRYLGTADAARYMNYSENHFRALIRAGKVPAPVRVAGKFLWRQSLLDQHMHALEVAQGVTDAA
ncbi:helix-turn-helix transcriptional regulator [Bradyrhizobium sp. USDA 4471]